MQAHNNHLESKADAKYGSENNANDQQSLQLFLIHCHTFENCLITWMVAMYQPLCSCEDQSFRDMNLFLNNNLRKAKNFTE